MEFANSQIASGATVFKNIVGKMDIDSGDFKISEGVLDAENTKVMVSGSGSIKNWTMDVLFDVKHNEPKNLQNYSIVMKICQPIIWFIIITIVMKIIMTFLPGSV